MHHKTVLELIHKMLEKLKFVYLALINLTALQANLEFMAKLFLLMLLNNALEHKPKMQVKHQFAQDVLINLIVLLVSKQISLLIRKSSQLMLILVVQELSHNKQVLLLHVQAVLIKLNVLVKIQKKIKLYQTMQTKVVLEHKIKKQVKCLLAKDAPTSKFVLLEKQTNLIQLLKTQKEE